MTLSNIMAPLAYLLMVLEENSFLLAPESQVIDVFHTVLCILSLYLIPQIWHPVSPLSLGLKIWEGQKILHSSLQIWLLSSYTTFVHTNNVLVSCLKGKCEA
jgi:predicted membrane channel-forming protein YqfA (hemolysin III family)